MNFYNNVQVMPKVFRYSSAESAKAMKLSAVEKGWKVSDSLSVSVDCDGSQET